MKPPKFLALMAQRAALHAEAQKLLGGENPSAEDLAKANDILKAQLPAIDSQIATYEALFEADRTAPAAITVRPRSEDDPKRGFSSMADFASAVRRTSPGAGVRPVYDPRLLAIAGADGIADPQRIGAAPSGQMEEGGTAGEGYLVPPEMRAEIWKLVFDDEGLLEFLQPEPTSSNAVKFNKDETTPWGASGVQAVWVDAGEQLTKSKTAAQRGTNELYRLAAYVLVDDNLEEDAPNLSNKLTVGAAGAINWKAEEAAMFGDGVGKPWGWMGSSALVTQTKETSQVAATIVTKNVSKMFSRCLNPTMAAWLCSKEILPQLMELTIGNQPVWTPPSTGLHGAPGGLLLGRPVKFSRHCQVLGTKGDIQLVDPSGYLLNIKTGGIKYASSIHLFFDYAVNAHRWMFRIGGTPILTTAVTPPKGANTESHFVTLETRA